MQDAQIGELIVGAYLRIIKDCQFVSYNREAPGSGNQSETDVVALKSDGGTQTIYGCEVVSHLDGPGYSTSKDASEWNEFNSAKEPLKRLWDKFESAHLIVNSLWPDADNIVLQFWSPVVREGQTTKGLDELQRRFHEEHDIEIELIYNSEYTKRVQELRDIAKNDMGSTDQPAYRFFQVLEHLRQ